MGLGRLEVNNRLSPSAGSPLQAQEQEAGGELTWRGPGGRRCRRGSRSGRCPLKKPSSPTKEPSSAWLPGFLKSCHLLISTKLNAKISIAISVSVGGSDRGCQVFNMELRAWLPC